MIGSSETRSAILSTSMFSAILSMSTWSTTILRDVDFGKSSVDDSFDHRSQRGIGKFRCRANRFRAAGGDLGDRVVECVTDNGDPLHRINGETSGSARRTSRDRGQPEGPAESRRIRGDATAIPRNCPPSSYRTVIRTFVTLLRIVPLLVGTNTLSGLRQGEIMKARRFTVRLTMAVAMVAGFLGLSAPTASAGFSGQPHRCLLPLHGPLDRQRRDFPGPAMAPPRPSTF